MQGLSWVSFACYEQDRSKIHYKRKLFFRANQFLNSNHFLLYLFFWCSEPTRFHRRPLYIYICIFFNSRCCSAAIRKHYLLPSNCKGMLQKLCRSYYEELMQ
ncbi:hypothetical protein V8G54_007995 [Vigna mungo]|uniref:Uncharacterized protein n=1 Tax=Vigna mungo TaxID=3915 RepID=A0AAQ3S8T8_VIGMU